jgi:iron(III) transport system ATP-binding protein
MSGVTLEGISLRFGATEVVSDLSLTVLPGEFVTLLGPSGCGKTSTLRMIAGLQHNSAGRVRIGDALVSDAHAGVFVPPEARHLGMVFQSYAIWPHMTVFDNVAYPLRVRRQPRARIGEQVAAVLRLVDMQAYAQRPATALSGGQQQRVAIARALVAEPAVLLLDEPLSNLDAKLRTQMGAEFRSLQRRLGITTIYVTHDQEEAMALSDRIVLMEAGRIRQVGTPQELYRRPADRQVAAFFGTPNFIEARVLATRAGERGHRIEFEAELGRGWCTAPASARIGDVIQIVLRPEDLTLVDAGASAAADALTIEGEVTDSVFRGGRASLVVDTGASRVGIDLPSSQIPATGSRIRAEARFDTLWAVAG